MKQLFFLIPVIALTLFSLSCKSKKTTVVSNDVSVSDKVVKYRVIISFISKGAGTDSKLNENITNYIAAQSKHPANVVLKWGREGENDQCYLLNELTKEEQKTFVAGLKKIVNGSDMVLIVENSAALHQGR
jgi:hypothetical protein